MSEQHTRYKPVDWRWIWRSLMLRRWQMATVFVLTLLIYAAGLALPIFAQIAIDSVGTTANRRVLMWLGAGALLAVIAEASLTSIRQRHVIELGSFLDRRVSLTVFAQLMRMRLFDANFRVGDVINRFQKTGNIRNFVLEIIPQAVFELGNAIISLILMCYYDSVIGGVVLIVNSCFAGLLRERLATFYLAAQVHFDADGQRQNFLSETVNAMITVKMLAIENRRIAKWKRLTNDFIAALRNVSEQSRRFLVGSHIATSAMTLIVLVIGCYRILTGAITVGDLLALQLLAARVSAPILNSGDILRQYQEVKVAISELAHFVAAPQERAGRQPARRDVGSTGLEVRNLSLRYTGAAAPALERVSFKLPDRGFIALVGRNGSGKSSLIRVLLGLHLDYEGEALIGGHSVRDYDPRSLRAAIGVVNQDTALFAGTIRENLSFGPTAATDEAVWRVLNFSAASAYVTKLPDSLDARLEENGRNLSGGQRQRLSIARAVIRKPKIMLLDEPTAFLDAEAAVALEKRLVQLGAKSLVLLVTHHLAAAKDAERILVLDDGVLAGDGQHDALLDTCGAYRKLWNDYQRNIGNIQSPQHVKPIDD